MFIQDVIVRVQLLCGLVDLVVFVQGQNVIYFELLALVLSVSAAVTL